MAGIEEKRRRERTEAIFEPSKKSLLSVGRGGKKLRWGGGKDNHLRLKKKD